MQCLFVVSLIGAALKKICTAIFHLSFCNALFGALMCVNVVERVSVHVWAYVRLPKKCTTATATATPQPPRKRPMQRVSLSSTSDQCSEHAHSCSRTPRFPRLRRVRAPYNSGNCSHPAATCTSKLALFIFSFALSYITFSTRISFVISFFCFFYFFFWLGLTLSASLPLHCSRFGAHIFIYCAKLTCEKVNSRGVCEGSAANCSSARCRTLSKEHGGVAGA